jgi:hypothetical protein
VREGGSGADGGEVLDEALERDEHLDWHVGAGAEGAGEVGDLGAARFLGARGEDICVAIRVIYEKLEELEKSRT